MSRWDEAWRVLFQEYLCNDEGCFFEILGEADMECCSEEEAGMGKELAGAMADMTIGVNEDEIAEAQETVHALRVLKAQRREQKALLEAEKRRIEFALDELKFDD